MRPTLLVPLALLLLGCGGAGMPSATRGRALRLKVKWPQRVQATRVIPTATLAIRVEVRRGGQLFDSQLLTGQSDTAYFDEVPVGTVEVRAIAYAGATGSGVPLAKGSVTATVQPDSPTDVLVTMTSEIVRLVTTPGPTLRIVRGTTTTVTAVAQNAAGETVPTDPSDITVFSDDPSICDGVSLPDGTFRVSGLAFGTTTLHFFDSVSEKEESLTVTVGP